MSVAVVARSIKCFHKPDTSEMAISPSEDITLMDPIFERTAIAQNCIVVNSGKRAQFSNSSKDGIASIRFPSSLITGVRFCRSGLIFRIPRETSEENTAIFISITRKLLLVLASHAFVRSGRSTAVASGAMRSPNLEKARHELRTSIDSTAFCSKMDTSTHLFLIARDTSP